MISGGGSTSKVQTDLTFLRYVGHLENIKESNLASSNVVPTSPSDNSQNLEYEGVGQEIVVVSKSELRRSQKKQKKKGKGTFDEENPDPLLIENTPKKPKNKLSRIFSRK